MKRLRIVPVIALLSFWIQLNSGLPDSPKRPCYRVDHGLSRIEDARKPLSCVYREVDGKQLHAFVFLPPEKERRIPTAAVLLFHGGGWVAGSAEWTYDNARRFAALGLAAVSIEYRLSGGEVTPIEALEDARAAFRWVRDRAGEFNIDAKRVAGHGVSAGGHLAAAAATIDLLGGLSGDKTSKPDLLLLWSPALDVVADRWFVSLLIGRAAPADYSPFEHAGASTPPTFIINGDKDTVTPLSRAERFRERVVRAGGTCELHVYPNVGHLLTRNLANQEDTFDPDPEFRADALARQERFLRDNGYVAALGEGLQAGDRIEINGVALRWCPPGRFRMGSPPSEPDRRPDEEQVDVTLTRGFWMGQYEVTQGQWSRIIGALPGGVGAGEGDDLPVHSVNYVEALEFCRRLTARAHESRELPSEWTFHLPTEAQWEYACRAGTRTATAFGDRLSSYQANFAGKPYNGAGQGPALNRAVTVGRYAPNAWGLHDMHGNAFEWCRDWYHSRLPGGDDPDLSSVKGTMNRDGTYSRVRRGGAWNDDGMYCRSAFRLRYEPERRSDHIGFRVAAVLK